MQSWQFCVNTSTLCLAFVPFTGQIIFTQMGCFCFVLKERYSLKYGDSFRIKRSTDITHPLVVSEKVHGWVYVLVQDTKNQVCAAEHASTSSSLYLTGSQNKTIGVFLFCFVFFFKKMCINANKNE